MPWKGIQNWSSSKGESYSETIQERDRIKASQVLELAPGQFIGFLSESNYIRCNMQYELGDYEKEEIPQVREVTQGMLDENLTRLLMRHYPYETCKIIWDWICNRKSAV